MLTFYLFKLCCLTAMTGFLFGYDTGIVSGSMIFIKDEMNLSTVWIEIIVSSTVAFAWITAWASSNLHGFGRRPLIMFASLLFTLASLIMGLAPNKYCLLVGRAIAGSAIGLGSMVAPIYIAELSPKERRGSLATFNSAFVTFGILGSTILAYAFSHLPSDIGWRFMLGFAGLPSLLQFIGFCYMPESPRYLCLEGKDEEALSVMTQIYGDRNKAEDEIRSIKASFAKNNDKMTVISKNSNMDGKKNGDIEMNGQTKSTIDHHKKSDDSYLKVLIDIYNDPITFRCLIIGILLHIGQQFSGINSIMYYGATVIQMSGVLSKRVAIGFTVVVGIANAVTSFVFLFLYDRITRRKITLWSMSGIVVFLGLMGYMFVQVDNQILPIKNHTDTYNGFSQYNLERIDYCRQINTCGGCVRDLNCGYCFDSSNIEETGRCLPRRSTEDKLRSIKHTYCSNGTNEDLGRYFSTENCPSDYGVPTLVSLCLFLFFYAFGMGSMPWTINSEIYPMWCREQAVGFATGFNWLFNLLMINLFLLIKMIPLNQHVSVSFLTITELFSVSGAFFLFMSVSLLLTVVYYRWLPETKNKSMEEEAIVSSH